MVKDSKVQQDAKRSGQPIRFELEKSRFQPITIEKWQNGKSVDVAIIWDEKQVAVEVALEDMEKEMIRKSLKRHGGRRKEAALELGISERTLYRKIKQYDL